MPKHAGGAQCLPQSRRRYSMSLSRALALVAPPIHAGPHPELIGGPARRRFTSYRGASPARIRFPPDNFKYSLTLFSKSFSSFPHDTCSLSVCHPYLAMDEIHCPIWAAFPNNPTRRECLMRVIPPDLGSRLERLSAKGSWSPDVRQAIPATTKRVKIQPSLAATSVDVDSHLGQPRARGARESSILPATTAGPVIDARCEGPMRPVIASNFRGLKGRSPSKKLATKGYLRIAMPEALPIQLRPGAHRRQKGRDDRINQVAFLIDADVALAWPAREGADGFKASATIVCKEHRTRQIGVDEVPMPTASTASENPDRRSWTTTSHDEASKAWYTRAAFRFTPRMKCERRKVYALLILARCWLGAMVPRCHGALVLWCHGATVPRCLSVLVPRYLGALVPRAFMPRCLRAMVPRCLAARCHGALVPQMPWCIGATMPWCSFASLAFQPSAMTNCVYQQFL
ncbi:Protein TAR1 [Capsicum annuum]|nr:Protein TAR1 [Capsicum annuum]